MSGFIVEIYEQPAALSRVLESFAANQTAIDALQTWSAGLHSGALNRVIFTGMGSSFHAAWPSVLRLEEHGIHASAIEASELTYYGQVDSHTLIVAISQSGRSIEVVKLIESLRQHTEHIPIVGVTNDPDSPLAQLSDLVLPMHAGVERTVSSKTYLNTLAVLDLSTRLLSGLPIQPALETIDALAEYIRTALPEWEKLAETVAEQLMPSRFLVFLGRGPSRGSAMTAALICKESTKLPTEGMVAGLFRHGPLEVVSPELATFIFAHAGRTEALNLGLARDLAPMAGQVFVIGSSELIPGVHSIPLNNLPTLDEWLLPLVEIVPIQLMAAKLAARRGFNVDQFVYGSKITVNE